MSIYVASPLLVFLLVGAECIAVYILRKRNAREAHNHV